MIQSSASDMMDVMQFVSLCIDCTTDQCYLSCLWEDLNLNWLYTGKTITLVFSGKLWHFMIVRIMFLSLLWFYLVWVAFIFLVFCVLLMDFFIYYHLKHFELRLDLKGALQINLPCFVFLEFSAKKMSILIIFYNEKSTKKVSAIP